LLKLENLPRWSLFTFRQNFVNKRGCFPRKTIYRRNKHNYNTIFLFDVKRHRKLSAILQKYPPALPVYFHGRSSWKRDSKRLLFLVKCGLELTSNN